MAREDLFSKLNIKDYNNQLEDVLENKSFSEDTKNILLSVLYKIETAYEDYSKVKVYVESKKELIEQIITIVKEKCNEIEIVKPRIDKKTKLKDKKYLIEKDKIIAYPNEKNIFYALNNLDKNKFVINNKNDILKEPMEKLLNIGYVIDKEEIIRDFDGWTWNIISEDIGNHIYNIIYQNIRMLIKNELLQNCINDKDIDFIKEFEKKLNDISEETNISKLIYEIAILNNVRVDKNKIKDILSIRDDLGKELAKMENKKEYLQEIANSKKIIEKEIKQIDEKINNNKLLRKSFIEENKVLEENKKIFSLSEYSEILQGKRQKLLSELENFSQLMKPMNFVKKKTEIFNKYSLLNEINFDISIDEELFRLLIDIQKKFLDLFSKRITNVQSKKEIAELIYLFRYYKLIYINTEKQIKDITELIDKIRKVEKQLITKACKVKTINILCQDIEKNYELVSKILSYNIIELEDVNLELKKHDKNIIVKIYDDETIEDTIICDENIEISVKFNRKIKLFS